MGEVYRARDTRLNRDVAIKISAAQFSERFEREAQAIAALNHPNICQIYDVGPNYLVMEFIEGAPLHGPLPARSNRCAVRHPNLRRPRSRAPEKHHSSRPEAGQYSCDRLWREAPRFRPGKNRNASAPSTPVGATQSIALTEVGTVMGTAAYMSPEQAKGEVSDARSYIFSFGAVLYEMLNGHSPFLRNSPMETMSAILRDEPAPLDTPSSISPLSPACLRKLPAGAGSKPWPKFATAIEQATATPSNKSSSIADLPFANMSAEKDNEYFSDGLAEEILNLLAKIPGLKVIARTSAFAFLGKEQDITQDRQALDVQHDPRRQRATSREPRSGHSATNRSRRTDPIAKKKKKKKKGGGALRPRHDRHLRPSG